MEKVPTVIIALLSCFVATTATAETRQATKKESATARAAVKLHLKDPSSAQFRLDLVTRPGAVCGMVNARNSNGGYTGFVNWLYITATSQVVILDHGDYTGDEMTLYSDNCD